MTGSQLPLATRVRIALVALTGVMLVPFAVAAVWGFYRFGPVGVAAAGVASGVCWLSGLAAVGVTLIFRDQQAAVQGVLFGMLLRMGAPLLLMVILFQSQSVLMRAGVMEMLVGSYLVGLLAETLLSWWISETAAGDRSSRMAKTA